MTYTVQVLDETTTDLTPTPARQLDFDSETVTIRELIRRRVYEECTEYNASNGQRFRGLVTPEGMERELNTPTVPRPRKIDWENSTPEHRKLSNATESSSSSEMSKPMN